MLDCKLGFSISNCIHYQLERTQGQEYDEHIVNVSVSFGSKISSDDRLKINEELIQNSTNTLLIHGDMDQVVPSIHLLEAKDFLIRNNVEVQTLLIKNCDHHIPIEASSTALNYILKKINPSYY